MPLQYGQRKGVEEMFFLVVFVRPPLLRLKKGKILLVLLWNTFY